MTMKAILYKQHTVQGKISRTALYLFGICLYAEEYPVRENTPSKPVGFIQFPSTAPTEVEEEDYYEDE